MSDETQAAATAAEPQTSAQTPAEQSSDEPREPAWLPARLERERRSMLRQLGVENVDDARAALDELKKRRDAERSEQERLTARLSELEIAAKRASELEGLVSARAASELGKLTEAQRSAVLALAGDDASKQLRAVETLAPTWVRAATPPAPIPLPASTTPQSPAPAASAAPTENHLATWEKLKEQNPLAAAMYLDRYQVEIVAAKRARH